MNPSESEKNVGCPHATNPSPETLQCSLLPASLRINQSVCQQCKSEWHDATPPSPSQLPATLTALKQSLPTPTPHRGLGDTIRTITKALRLPHCRGCAKRQKWLNERFPG